MSFPVGLQLFYPVKPFTFPITQHFGENPQWYPLTNGHNGIDWGVPLRTPIYATLPGRVIRVASDNSGYGNHIRIQHDNNLLSLYGHFDEDNYALVHEGDQVQQGQHIGYSGNTGRSTGPHLHFEVRYNNVADNPEPCLVTQIVGEHPLEHPAILFKVKVLEETQPYLNVRSGPSLLYPIVGTLAPGSEIDVIDISGNEIWVQTSKGFIALRYNNNELAQILSMETEGIPA